MIPHRDAHPRLRSLGQLLVGPDSTRRMAATHALEGLADGLVTMSLVGSLFFSVSLQASRSRVLIYLVLTAAPLALAAPLVGPALDRLASGYRAVIVSSLAVRIVLALLLSQLLLSPGFFPAVFGILLCRKAYGLGRTAITSQLVTDPSQLVSANAHIALTGTAAGGVGTAIGGILLATAGPGPMLAGAAVGFAVASVVALGLPTSPAPATVTQPVVEVDRTSDVDLSVWAVATTRAATGAVTFLLAFALKRGGSDTWVFAAALATGGLGAFVGTMIAGRLHEHLTAERMLALALFGPGIICAVGVVTVGEVGIVVIAFAIGMGTSVATRSMEAIYSLVPVRDRGRVIARSEVRFQIANLVGAALSVVATPAPRPGFAVVAVALVFAGIGYASGVRISLRGEATRFLLRRHRSGIELGLPAALLGEADRLVELGANRLAVCVADCAVRSARHHAGWRRRPGDEPLDERRWQSLHPCVEAVLRGDRIPTDAEGADVVDAARQLVGRLGAEAAAETDQPRPVDIGSGQEIVGDRNAEAEAEAADACADGVSRPGPAPGADRPPTRQRRRRTGPGTGTWRRGPGPRALRRRP